MILDTDMGRVRTTGSFAHQGLLFECPGCAEWLPISDEMFEGRVSINHAADGCRGGYHETVDLSSARVTLTLRDVEGLRRG